MSEVVRRLIPACFVALLLHIVVLAWQVHQAQVTLPAPLALQRIAVSLGQKPVTEKQPPTPEQEPKPEPEPEQKKEVVPQPIPIPKPTEPQPVVKPVVQPVAKPQPVQERQIESPPVLSKPRQETQTVSREDPEPHHAEVEGKSTNAETAAHVIQQAAPLYQVNPPPEYPRLARRRGLEGIVLLEVLVDVLGRVKKLRVFNSSGHSILDRAAVKAVRRWEFSSGAVGGEAKEMWVKVPVRFQLKGS